MNVSSLPNDFKKLAIDTEEAGNEDKEQQHSNEGAEGCAQTPEQNKGEKVAEGTAKIKPRQLFRKDRQDDGLVDRITVDREWLNDHPWDQEKYKSPPRHQPMDDTICKSGAYKLLEEYMRTKKDIDLKKIYEDLPKFIGQMKGPSSRQDLESLVGKKIEELREINKDTPHLLEILNKNVAPKDKPSKGKPDEEYKAFSLPQQANQDQPLKIKMCFLDCEYMLKMHLSKNSSKWFNVKKKEEEEEEEEEESKLITIEPTKKDKRWIFIPSFRRAEIALLDWPADDIVKGSTIRILVVRPSEFKKYVEKCGRTFPVICLPQDEIGAGYPRFWIQKIALRLKLHFIWMIDDSVECFYEYHPTERCHDYTNKRRRSFGSVFKRIEKLVKQGKEGDKPIAAMSPRVFRGPQQLNKSFDCSPPRVAVFLNLEVLKSKEVYYRPELQAFEDMIFAYECEQNGLKVFMDNRVHLQDHQWADTGTRSPSVKQCQEEKKGEGKGGK